MTQPSSTVGTEPSGSQQNAGTRTVATFTSYGEAERAVEYLAEHKFPVQKVAIVGLDVRMVEQVIGRLGWGRAALHGAATGAVTGALIGWIFGVFSWIHPLIAGLTLAAYGLITGAVIGAIIGLIIYATQRGRRDFTAIRAMQPSRYEVVVGEEVAGEAAQLLGARLGAHAAETTT
jgi:uncharacterized protein YqgC (DUF456 family)